MGFHDLTGVIHILEKTSGGEIQAVDERKKVWKNQGQFWILKMLRQDELIEAVVLAAAGHNMLMVGSPDVEEDHDRAGFQRYFPEMTEEECLEVTKYTVFRSASQWTY